MTCLNVVLVLPLEVCVPLEVDRACAAKALRRGGV